ncbi:Aminotransferase class-III [Cordyceps fumosorosea ARSEF 2679]|uniref:Aminotransferase class-III n=1 Tax=Cordyceps fumosorosea (strain ARSEF 2679) TaxID=1081104 RepID=A0A167XEJ0_CORFA|nr:Aminotransferase class-III [Cordyceps fumosorosea ARSEF 2679]OAA64878.1 Aminotransferase class-III [Cordyceps fumosorosea ARSEF 2679]
MSSELQAALEVAVASFVARNPKSKALHEEAVKTFPGGNTRTVLHTSPFPLCMKSGKDFQVVSEDGDTYTDLTAEFTAGLYGHSHPVILAALDHVVRDVGLSVGATTAQEQLFARALCDRFGLERVRLANSGTEANLHALAAAKLFTKKSKVVAFGGGYHGAVLGFKDGKVAPNNVDKADWIVAKYNDVEGAVEAVKSEGVAAVILEPMQGSGGCIYGTAEFLTAAGVVFIVDEVMTSRISGGGLAAVHGLKPDMKTFGKWLGGGVAFGAFGGREDIMAVYDPRVAGSAAHSGTFNNNTLVTHCGHAGLTQVYTPAVADAFTRTGDDLLARLNQVSEGTKLCFTGTGTVATSHFVAHGPRDIADALDVTEIGELKDLFWFYLLENGFWVTRRGFYALVLGTPQSELDRLVAVVKDFLTKYAALVKVEAA